MTGRDFRVSVFNHTLKVLKENEKTIHAQNLSILKQKIYIAEEQYFEKPEAKFEKTNIVVTKNRTMEAGRAWSKKGNTAVLNFASATTPGGGVVKGSSAQEECLCRVSSLYNCLNQNVCWSRFYNPHRKDANVVHNNDIIYTPKVIGIKDDDYNDLDEKDFYYVDVITCAAPNLREVPNNGWCNVGESNNAVQIPDDELYNVHLSRAKAILNVAAENKIHNLVLGAFGCGAFQNNPEVVAKAYKTALDEFQGVFENIEFAIYCKDYETQNYEIFKKILED